VGGPVTWSWEKIKTNLSPKNISTWQNVEKDRFSERPDYYQLQAKYSAW
jgi:hypothetical protein